MQISKHLNPKLKYKFCELRDSVLGACFDNVWQRLMEQKRFVPSEEEVHMDTIWELIEPQVKDAVKELNKKGYCTTDSGFIGKEYQKQFIGGVFKLDDATTKLLESKGISIVEDSSWTYIEFIAKNPDLDEIKQTWDEVVALMPDLGRPSKTRDEILHYDQEKIVKKLIELGKIEDPKKKPRPDSY